MALLCSASVLTPSPRSFPRFAPLPELRRGGPSLSLLKRVPRTSRCDSLSFVCPPPEWGLQSLRRRRQCRGTVCYAAPFSPETLRWVSAVSTVVLMVANGTAIRRSFLAPLFALQAPISVLTWIKGELDLPFFTMLLAIVAPYQALNLRGTQAGEIISLAIAGYLTVQHFSRAGSLRRAFDQGSIIATIAIICLTVTPCVLLI